MKVWVIETGDYEQRIIFGIAASPEAAVAYIKAEYSQPPYIVQWEELRWDEKKESDTEQSASITGIFQQVSGYPYGGRNKYDISSWEVEE